MAESERIMDFITSLFSLHRTHLKFAIALYFIFTMTIVFCVEEKNCNGVPCYNGNCTQNMKNNTGVLSGYTYCKCFDGWTGSSCSLCIGRIR